MRFLTSGGDTRTFLRRRGEVDVGIVEDARWVTGSVVPLPTVMGRRCRTGVGRERLPALDDMCEEAPVSRYHSAVSGVDAVELAAFSAARRAWWF
jgi:hypothetical protein